MGLFICKYDCNNYNKLNLIRKASIAGTVISKAAYSHSDNSNNILVDGGNSNVLEYSSNTFNNSYSYYSLKIGQWWNPTLTGEIYTYAIWLSN